MAHSLVLITDDDEDDRFFIRQALEKHVGKVTIQEAVNGQEALNLLQDDPAKADFKIILLDINMPVLNGLETLKIIRANTTYRCIPIVVLSTSDDPDQVRKAYEIGANSYIKKPHRVADYGSIAKAIDCCFLGVGL